VASKDGEFIPTAVQTSVTAVYTYTSMWQYLSARG